MTELTAEAFREMVTGNMPAVVDFWAEWCMPCKIFAPVMEEIAGEMDGEASFGKVNVDEEGGLAEEFGVQSIPTLLIFSGGEVKERLVGVRPREEVTGLIRKYAAKGGADLT